MDLEAIEKRYEASTQGTVYFKARPYSGSYSTLGACGVMLETEHKATSWLAGKLGQTEMIPRVLASNMTEEDAQFFIHAHQDIPALVTALKAAQGRVEALERLGASAVSVYFDSSMRGDEWSGELCYAMEQLQALLSPTTEAGQGGEVGNG